MNPGMRYEPERSTTTVPCGAATEPWAPMSWIRPPHTRTDEEGRGGPPRPSITVTLVNNSDCGVMNVSCPAPANPPGEDRPRQYHGNREQSPAPRRPRAAQIRPHPPVVHPRTE